MQKHCQSTISEMWPNCWNRFYSSSFFRWGRILPLPL